MNEKLVTGIIVVLIILGGISIFSGDSESISEEVVSMEGEMVEVGDTVAMESEEMMMLDVEHTDPTMVTDSEDSAVMSDLPGTYELYSSEKVANATTDDVVIYFKASWCPSCKVADADIKANAKNIPSSLTLLHVDYDTATELKKKYRVRMQHTFVQVDKAGNLIKLWTGIPSLEKLVLEIE